MSTTMESPAPPYSPQTMGQEPKPAQYQSSHSIPTISTSNVPTHSGPQMMMVENKPAPVAPTTTPLNLLRERPENVWCPTKGAIVQTRAESKDSDKTWFAVIGICLICPCAACFPLKGCCGDGMLQDWDHYCSGCGKQITHRPYNKEQQIVAPDHDTSPQPGRQQTGYQQLQQPQYTGQ
ncbi:hypothetical protein CLAFUW4_07241 [Fulvia fulva]|uniref:LITAF domain-containing protein n=1 Tax=Passalora fulva TaxID=5499 RepID=A0A9Q8PAD0_PASFU|nr:uncharacterized protein CLAFUR5_07373 [Fulvia fulva]KAK4621512.1 hypothetical protein CLAFUR4_07249 [Fulvia fulva]KAK4623049.1 hypothetical protein CLAFUR0_07246 [Fulvia fulva]UJO18814.1 hypothetical protein CLAFUR5_07373 [Fulvia fulva]WPV16190.1 hypothetical protein CLAFUW4_07241 [Fulvia fulva]WPV30621.1 hypothetical protein CLAFUW7_07242 [Fulvia fulva]